MPNNTDLDELVERLRSEAYGDAWDDMKVPATSLEAADAITALRGKLAFSDGDRTELQTLCNKQANELDTLRAENERLKAEITEWLCESCNAVHKNPATGSGLMLSCPTWKGVVRPTSQTSRILEDMNKQLAEALRGLLGEWDKFTRYGSPMAKLANERVNYARSVYSRWESER